jgi:hypothetical protein
MADDATRRLLKVFGVSVTECEDAVVALEAALRGGAAPGVDEAFRAWDRAARDLAARWAEVGQLIFDYHGRAARAVADHLRAPGPA